MLTARVHFSPYVARLVLVGTLEPEDLPGAEQALQRAAVGASTVRLVLVKMWRADVRTLDLLQRAAHELRATGRACPWVGPLPKVQALLHEAEEHAFICAPDAEDMIASFSWGFEPARPRTDTI